VLLSALGCDSVRRGGMWRWMRRMKKRTRMRTGRSERSERSESGVEGRLGCGGWWVVCV
jgi:hypothetical protein